jgi:hypothetical protein
LLPFFGLYYMDARLCLVSPWLENGNIMEFLRKNPQHTDRLPLVSLSTAVNSLANVCVPRSWMLRLGSNICMTKMLSMVT